MKIVKLTPSGWFLLLLGVGLGLHFLSPWHFSSSIDIFYARFFGIKALCVSGLINFFALRSFSKHETPYAPDTLPVALLQTGIFAISRNPVYGALVLAMVGLSGILNTVWLLLTSVTLWLALDKSIIPNEEAKLSDTFGEAYDRYREVTRRWL